MHRPRIIPHGKNKASHRGKAVPFSCQEGFAKKSKFVTFDKDPQKKAKNSFPQDFSITLWKSWSMRKIIHSSIRHSAVKSLKNMNFSLLSVEKPVGIVDNFMHFELWKKQVLVVKCLKKDDLTDRMGLCKSPKMIF